jgi:hypothetical protein
MPDNGFEWHSRSKAEDDECSWQPSTSKMTENAQKNWRNYPRKTVAKQSMSSQTLLDQLWSLPGDLNRKSEHAPHCHHLSRLPTDCFP